MRFDLDPTRREPVYLQIVQQVKLAVARGIVRAGDQLPPVRELALQLLINPNTVQRAYRELMSERVLYSRKGLGVFVAEPSSNLNAQERGRRLAEAADGFIAEAIHLGCSRREIANLVRERLRVFRREEAKHA